MKLSAFFEKNAIRRDASFECTSYTSSTYSETLTFALDSLNMQKALDNPSISAIITYDALAKKNSGQKGLAISKSPKRDFFLIHNRLCESGMTKAPEQFISGKANISPLSSIKKNVIIEDNVTVEDFAVIESGSILREGVYIASHAVIGGRGMHNTFVDGKRVWVQDAGGVILEKGVQVLSHAVVQKPYFCENTIVGENSIISVHANVGHGCRIGNNTMVAGNATLAGYVWVGNDVWIGPSVTVAHGIKVSDNARILLGSVVIGNVDFGSSVSGNFALKHHDNMMNYSKRLTMIKRVEKEK